jgi:hypothetical protein
MEPLEQQKDEAAKFWINADAVVAHRKSPNHITHPRRIQGLLL